MPTGGNVNKERNMKKMILRAAVAAAGLALIFSGCATDKSVNKDAYYNENIKDFSRTNLKNGIPVIFKKTGSSQIFVMRVIFEGGTPLVEKKLAGIEKLTMDLMFHGSAGYSYEDIQKMQYTTTFSMTNSSGRDYSVAGIKCLEKDLDSVLAVFADAINNPLFAEEDFVNFMRNAEEGLASSMSNPSGQLSIELEKAAFGNSSYISSPDITEESVKNITLDDVKKHWSNLLDAGRIKIVVVSGFDGEAQAQFVEKLNSYFGDIKKGDYKAPFVRKISVSGENISVKNPQAGTSAYSIGFFDCPEKYDEDYVPFAISLMYLDDIFFEKVREEAGAVYSIGTGILGGKELLGAISAYKISDKENINRLIMESINSFPDEKGVEEKLDQYKNKYITTIFGASQNSTGVAANIINSMEYSGDPAAYLKRSSQVVNVKPQDVVKAYKKYLAQNKGPESNPIRWVTVSAD